MNDQVWWQRWPDLLIREMTAFDEAGMAPQQDEAASAKGVMRVHLTVRTDDRQLNLSVVYPDAYPYFRPQVYAPELDLPFHQNPFQRNLCLIGRRTHFWNNEGTAAELIQEQLPKLLVTAKDDLPETEAGLEQQQAEPFGDFYPCSTMILVQSDWSIGGEHHSGRLTIRMLADGDPRTAVPRRGAVLEVRSEGGEVLCRADDAVRRIFDGKEVEGRWARVDAPIRIEHQGEFINELLRQRPAMRDAKPSHVDGKWLRIWAVLFPEQIAHRVTGEGWVFACAQDVNRPHPPIVQAPHFGHGKRHLSKKRGRK